MTTGASEIISIVAVSVGLVSALGNYLYTNHRFKAQNYPVIAYRMDLKHQSRDHACLSLAPLNLHTTVPVQKLSMGIRLARSRRVPLWPWRWRRYHTAAWELVGPAEGCPHECSEPTWTSSSCAPFPDCLGKWAARSLHRTTRFDGAHWTYWLRGPSVQACTGQRNVEALRSTSSCGAGVQWGTAVADNTPTGSWKMMSEDGDLI